MNDPQVRVGVGVFVRCPQGYALLRRKGSHGEGEWSLPGGHLEFGESVIECAKREIMKELGVEIDGITAVPYFSEDQFPDHGKHYITLYVSGYTAGTPTIMEPHKASGLMFVNDGDEMPHPLFCGTAVAWQVLTSL